jgi:predicted RecB family nuclease
LRLWYQCYDPQLASEVSPAKQAIFNTGHEVGKMATRLYPDGRLVEEDHFHHQDAVRSTEKLMNDPQVPAIFEAAFFSDNVRVRADIIERRDDGSWNLVEVKSSTSVKHVYITDVAIQYHVLKGSGVKINRAGILFINNQYLYDGHELDLESLFSYSDLTEQVVGMQAEIEVLLKELGEMLACGRAPDIQPSRHCMRPYLCEFWDYCTRNMPEFWVLNLNGITQERLDELAEIDVQDIRDIPDSFQLTPIQDRIRTSVKKQTQYISDELEKELTDVIYPIHFLDFETASSAIPRYANTRPYQAVPFQWSNHILNEDGTLQHHAYLCREDKDPREEFTVTLLEELAKEGTIFIYTTYEKTIIGQLAQHLPQYHDQLNETLSRFKDLCDIIRKHYYHAKFHGSCRKDP